MVNNVNGKFSIILPYYNGRKYIREAVESVLGQTYKNLELIIIDDGSSNITDSEFLSSFIESAKDARIRYYKRTNSGLSDTRNYGIRISNGEYLCFIDQDDLWDKDKLQLQADVFAANPAVNFICTDGRNIGEESLERRTGSKWGFKGGIIHNTFGKLLIGNFVICSSVAFRRSVIAEVGYSDRNYKVVPDYEYFLRFSEKMDFYFIPKSVVSYRIHEGNTSRQRLNAAREVVSLLSSKEPVNILDRVSLVVNITRQYITVLFRSVFDSW